MALSLLELIATKLQTLNFKRDRAILPTTRIHLFYTAYALHTHKTSLILTSGRKRCKITTWLQKNERTNGRTDGQSDRVTESLLELLIAAKNDHMTVTLSLPIYQIY